MLLVCSANRAARKNYFEVTNGCNTPGHSSLVSQRYSGKRSMGKTGQLIHLPRLGRVHFPIRQRKMQVELPSMAAE